MRSRHTGLKFHIDTNRINARQNLDNMNLLEDWKSKGVISLDMSETATCEAFAGLDIKRKEKTRNYWSSQDFADTPEERRIIESIENILFPSGAQNNNQKNDVKIVFNARKYIRYLITNDGGSKKQPGGILGNSERLEHELGIKVLTDEEAISLVKRFIKNRDITCKKISNRTSEPLPNWVGKD